MADAKTQFIIYKNRAQGVFSSDKVLQHAESMPAHMWWEMYGAEVKELQFVAMKVLSKRSSACSVERLWSLFGVVWCKQRARLGPARAVDLVKAGSNLRLKRKLLNLDYEVEMRSWTYDPEESDGDDDEEDGEGESEQDGARTLA